MIDNKTRDRLISDYSSLLTRLCISLCKNTHDAQDLFQETWLRVLTSTFDYRDGQSAKTYLIRTCVNAYKNFYNERKKHPLESIDEEKQKYIDSIPDSSSYTQEYPKLYDAVRKLSYKHRTVIALCYFHDLSEKEIAKILSVPLGTVKSRLHSAKSALRKELEK